MTLMPSLVDYLWAMALSLFAVSATAQDTRIISFVCNEELVWINTATNTYCGLEWTSNLQYPWQAVAAEPPYWNIQATQTVMAVANIGNLSNLWEQASFLSAMVGDPVQGVFLRIVASTNQLDPQYVTNSLRVVNHTMGVISNTVFAAAIPVEFGT